MKRLSGGDDVKVRVNQKGHDVGVAAIREALKDEILSGKIMSVSVFPQKSDTVKIKLRRATNPEVVHRICRKLQDTGYSTKVFSVDRDTLDQPTRFSRSRSSLARHISGSRGSMIITAKVNTPNLPDNPSGLPDPGGKKPNKRK